MMNAEKIAKGIENMTNNLKWYTDDYNKALDMLKAEMASDKPNMDTVIAYANNVKEIENRIQIVTEKRAMLEAILNA